MTPTTKTENETKKTEALTEGMAEGMAATAAAATATEDEARPDGTGTLMEFFKGIGAFALGIVLIMTTGRFLVGMLPEAQRLTGAAAFAGCIVCAGCCAYLGVTRTTYALMAERSERMGEEQGTREGQ